MAEQEVKKDLMSELLHIQNELEVPKTMYNSFSNFKYRSAEGILAALKPLLEVYGLTQTMSDKIISVGDRVYVESTVTVYYNGESHSVTASAREEETLKGQIAAQITGGCSSYARKYALCGMYNIDDEGNDPDGSDNSKYASKSAQPQPVKAPVVAKPEVSKSADTAPAKKYASELQIKLLYARSRDKSGLDNRDDILDWFKNKTGYNLNEVPFSEVQTLIEIVGA